MTYGIQVRRTATEDLITLTTVAGRVFIGTYEVPAATTQSFDLTNIPSANNFITYILSAGGHTITKSTVTSGGSTYARLTFTRNYSSTSSVRRSPSTKVAVFADGTKEPDYGMALTNNDGLRTASTIYPVPVFLQKVTFGGSRTSDTVNVSGIWYTHTASVGGVGRERIVFYTIPSNTNTSVYYWGNSYLSTTDSTVAFNVNVPNSTTIYQLPEAYVFLLSMQKSSENYGMRIFDSNSNVTFDSGLQHIDILGTTSLSFSTTETALGTNISTTSAILMPNYFRETSVGVSGAALSDVNTYYGVYRRSGTTSVVTKELLVETGREDANMTYSEIYGATSNTTVIIDANRFAQTSTGGITIEILSSPTSVTTCSYNVTQGGTACTTTETLSASTFGGDGTTPTYSWSLDSIATTNGFVFSGSSTSVNVTVTNNSPSGSKTGTLTLTVTQSGTNYTKTYTLNHTHTAIVDNLTGSIALTSGSAGCSYPSTATTCTTTATYTVTTGGGSAVAKTYQWSLTNNTGGLALGSPTTGTSVTVTKTGGAGTYSATLNCIVTQSGTPNSPYTISQPIQFAHSAQAAGNVVQPIPGLTIDNANVVANTFTGSDNTAGIAANAYIRLYILNNGQGYLVSSDAPNRSAALSSWWWSGSTFNPASPAVGWDTGVPGIGNNYWVRFTKTAFTGSTSASTNSTGWLSLSTDRYIEVTATSNTANLQVINSGTYKVEISSDQNGATILSTTNGPKLVADALRE